MIQFVLGTAGSGKSTYLMERLKQLSDAGERGVLIVPEQFSFATERAAFQILGAAGLHRVTVTSFTRLRDRLFQEFGGGAGVYADDATKLVLMNRTLREIAYDLSVYRNMAHHPLFAKRMLAMIGELKHARIDSDQLASYHNAASPDATLLEKKVADLAAIYQHYEARLSRSYLDPLDDAEKLATLIRKNNYFSDCVLLLDEFKSFTAHELSLLQQMMGGSKQMMIALCTDGQWDQQNSLFSVTNRTYQTIKRLGREAGIPIAAPIKLASGKRFSAPALAHLERHILRTHGTPSRFVPQQNASDQTNTTGTADLPVTTIVASDLHDEVREVAAIIWHLVAEEGYRYRDIVVVSRTLPTYQESLATAFSHYDIPYYLDTLKSLSHTPLVRLISLCFDCILEGYPFEHLIGILKCDLCGLSIEEIAQFENYLYLWNLSGASLKRPFSMSIFGMRLPESDEEILQNEVILIRYNELRTQMMGALEAFRERVTNATAPQIGQAVAMLLTDLGVQPHLEGLIGFLSADPSGVVSMEQAADYRRVWEICGQLTQTMCVSPEDFDASGEHPLPHEGEHQENISPADWRDLFLLLCDQYDLGTVPQTLDSVVVGSVERIRTDTPAVVFVLGACDGIFPYLPQTQNLLSDVERQALEQDGIVFGSLLGEQLLEERFLAYQAMTLPSERLYLSMPRQEVGGGEHLPSVVFSQLEAMFGDDINTDTALRDPLFYCTNRNTTLFTLATHYQEDTPFTATLREYFDNLAEKEPASSLEVAQATKLRLLQKPLPKQLTDPALVGRLYGKTLSVSPSRVEDYHLCKFLYFCKHGMRLFPRERVSLGPSSRGQIIHEVLFSVCKQMEDFKEFDEQAIKRRIKESLEGYLGLCLGGESVQTKRTLYLFRRMAQTIFQIFVQLFAELSQSGFQPVAYEYAIGGTATGQPSAAKPLLLSTADGVKLYLNGQVDRIDIYDTKAGQRYLRVIDYKSGKKTFRLSDVMHGINLQMLLYLLCLERNEHHEFGQVKGAGVLYLPVGDPVPSLSRGATPEEVAREREQHYRMRGLVVDDEQVLLAMERDLGGKYLPVKVKKAAYDQHHTLLPTVFSEQGANESLFESRTLESLVTYEQMGRLFTRIETMLLQMAAELYRGDIKPFPLREDAANGINPCRYCDYRLLCGFGEEDQPNHYHACSKKQLFALLEAES